MTKTEEMQRIIQRYKKEHNVTEVDLYEVSKYAAKKLGWPLPKPKDPIDLLANQFAKAARQETRHDKKTGRPYRVNHAVPVTQGSRQYNLWVDIDEAPRPQMHKSCIRRREQMVGDALQLTLDIDHWNDTNSDKEPIVMPLDLEPDVEWRKNSPEEDTAA